MLVPRKPTLTPADETVTVRVSDLYDYMRRHASLEELPMPDTNSATTVKKVKRGFRKVSMTLRVQEYEMLAQMAAEEERTADQQAAYLLRQKLSELSVEAIKGAYREAEARRNGEAEEMEEVVFGPADDPVAGAE